MKFSKILLWVSYCLFFLVNINTLNAQTISGKITGRVLDLKKAPLDGAQVALTLKKDSSLVKQALLDVNGAYSFEGIGPGEYDLSVSYMGRKQVMKTSALIDAQHTLVHLDDFVFSEKTIQ